MSEDDRLCFFCNDCNKYLTRKNALNHLHEYGHSIRPKLHPKYNLKVFTDGSFGIAVFVDKILYNVIPNIVIYRAPDKTKLKNPRLSTMHLTKAWYPVGKVRRSGDLKNLSRKLSLSCGAQTRKISEKELEELFVNAIKNGRAKATSNPNVVEVYLALNTDLQNIPKNETSRWIVATEADIKNSEQDPVEVEKVVAERAKLLRNIKPAVGM
ncbi:MAG: hypothetical protein PVH73_01605 [Candidatus Bathyarchaeota archaeon]|jgi:hypothetical protein